ncbi:hypothetical protein RND71_023514 [Anisodus tanguticus]|uniref:Uncharacterized protein n=1 Tax=Anisodus tanguticus TaxID=243964 RepID=A0AAE1RVA4_9SOLA|nr:hypothetical protein RND71_023514 [Anisodus tanguticus]
MLTSLASFPNPESKASDPLEAVEMPKDAENKNKVKKKSESSYLRKLLAYRRRKHILYARLEDLLLQTDVAVSESGEQFKPIVSVPAGLHPPGLQSQLIINNRRRLRFPVQEKRASIICGAALNARCAEGQTQTVTRESSTITVAPVQGNLFMLLIEIGNCAQRSTELDDGGSGFPPRDDDGGGGGGGGGGGHWKGGFFFFGFLVFLGFLKDQE